MTTCSYCNFVPDTAFQNHNKSANNICCHIFRWGEISEDLVIICSSCVIGIYTELKNVFEKNSKYNVKANKIK